MNIDLSNTATFGVAGNFTGHLEQAGEAKDFTGIKTSDAVAPKAVFPTYIPSNSEGSIPNHLKIFPFGNTFIEYPHDQEKLQIEPECAIICQAEWDNDTLVRIIPKSFAASNDCSIRRDGAPKISFKKNWGRNSKGISDNQILIDQFSPDGNINDYRIASFLLRDNVAHEYGEDSAVSDYSYIYDRLCLWLIDKFNNQKDEGPAEDIHSYLIEAGKPDNLLISIGATRYTEYGQNNFLRTGDHAVVVLYPGSKYTFSEIKSMVESGNEFPADVSILNQEIISQKEIKAVIFDLDGTLIDTEKIYRIVWPETMRELGYEMDDDTFLKLRSLGRPFAPAQFKEWYGESFDYDKARRLRRKHFNEYIEKHPIEKKAGAIELINYLHSKGIITAIATATDIDRAEEYMRMTGLWESNGHPLFDRVISATMVKAGKPEPDVYLYACSELGLRPEECIAVEDAPNGVLSASRAGLNVIMVPDLSEPDEKLKRLLTNKVSCLTEIEKLV